MLTETKISLPATFAVPDAALDWTAQVKVGKDTFVVLPSSQV
jgi:hypothetical protein